MNEQQRAPRAKEHPPEAWEAVREAFTELYQGGNYSLKSIIGIMKLEYGLDANERQWKGKIRKWSLEKNVKTEEATFMLYKKAIREHRDGKATVFRLNGRIVEPCKLQQFEKRYKSQRNAVAAWSPNTLGSLSMATPTNISYHTPCSPGRSLAIVRANRLHDQDHHNESSTATEENTITCSYCFHITRGQPAQALRDYEIHLLGSHIDRYDQFMSFCCNLCTRIWSGPTTNLLWMFELHLRADHYEHHIMLGCGHESLLEGLWNAKDYDRFELLQHYQDRVPQIYSDRLPMANYIYGCKGMGHSVTILATILARRPREQTSKQTRLPERLADNIMCSQLAQESRLEKFPLLDQSFRAEIFELGTTQPCIRDSTDEQIQVGVYSLEELDPRTTQFSPGIPAEPDDEAMADASEEIYSLPDSSKLKTISGNLKHTDHHRGSPESMELLPELFDLPLYPSEDPTPSEDFVAFLNENHAGSLKLYPELSFRIATEEKQARYSR